MTEERREMENELNGRNETNEVNQLTKKQVADWIAKDKINEVAFCQELLEETPMICFKGSFFTVDGRISDERSLKKRIYEKLKPHVMTPSPRAA